MKVIRRLDDFPDSLRGGVATIGNFDGVHLGHRQILNAMKDIAVAEARSLIVIIFTPHPRQFFAPDVAFNQIMSFREKLCALEKCGVDAVVCLRFNRAMSSLSHQDFARDILVETLGISTVFVGDDFKYGRKRQGNFDTLTESGLRLGFDVKQYSTVTERFGRDEKRVSSTDIRRLIANGSFDAVARLLCQPYCISGKVMHGNKKGRTIGFPTANILAQKPSRPLAGVFAVQANGGTIGQQPRIGVANLGTRPTVTGQTPLLEVHLFDFDGSLYGERINVQFIQKIRNEKKFDTFEQLKTQIQKDVSAAKTIFKDINN